MGNMESDSEQKAAFLVEEAGQVFVFEYFNVDDDTFKGSWCFC